MLPRFNEQIMQVALEAFDKRIRVMNDDAQIRAKVSQSKFELRKTPPQFQQAVLPPKREPVRIVAQPLRPANALREYVLEIKEYDDILRTTCSMVAVMERTPSVFAPMDEEPLRTIWGNLQWIREDRHSYSTR
jgi:hypothetical protein